MERMNSTSSSTSTPGEHKPNGTTSTTIAGLTQKTNRQPERDTNAQTERQADRQTRTDRQKDREREREREAGQAGVGDRRARARTLLLSSA
eukprot:3665151-Rhodomonas_salina.1